MYGVACTTFSERHVKKLEQWIDGMDQQLPELKNFILPASGGYGPLYPEHIDK